MAGAVHPGGPRLPRVRRGEGDPRARAGVDVQEEELVALGADDGVAAVEPGLLLGKGSGREGEVEREMERAKEKKRESEGEEKG